MKPLTLTLLLLANAAYALEADEIRKIAAEPHDRKDIMEELKIYTDAREFKITRRDGAADKELQPGPEVLAKEKVVRGKYIVTEIYDQGAENPIILVVTFDNKTDTFKKWTMLQDGSVMASIGVADLEKRTIAWASSWKHDGDSMSLLIIESHADDKSTWKGMIMHGEKIIHRTQGLAVKTK